MVRGPICLLWRSPVCPAILFINDENIVLAPQLGLNGFFGFQVIQILQKQQPGGLLGIIKLCCTARLFPEDIINIFEGLLKHIGFS